MQSTEHNPFTAANATLAVVVRTEHGFDVVDLNGERRMTALPDVGAAVGFAESHGLNILPEGF